jgi:hypothetical protein
VKQKVVVFVCLVFLFFCGLLFFKILITQGILFFDSYYSENSQNNIELYLEKGYSLIYYSTIISLILTAVLGVVIGRLLKPGYYMLAFTYLLSFIFFRLFYIDIFKLFTFTDNAFLNSGILGVLLLIIILICVSRLMSLSRKIS